MTDKELHRLGRRELLQLLLEQGIETEKLKRTLEETENELHQLQETYERLRKRLDHKDEQIHELNDLLEAERTKREIELSESGSIAEAALRLNMIFDVAQKAADQYLYNIKRLHNSEEELPKIAELLAAETITIPETTSVQEQITVTEDDENPKVIQLEHIKAEKIRRAEQEADGIVQTASAVGAEEIRESTGIKISESGMRAIVTELRPQETEVKTQLVEEEAVTKNQNNLEVNSEPNAKQQVLNDMNEQEAEKDKREAKRGTFFQQMSKFMRFKVK